MQAEAPICSHCKLPKKPLAEKTAKKSETIWVCSDKPSKSKACCDGDLHLIATKNAGLD